MGLYILGLICSIAGTFIWIAVIFSGHQEKAIDEIIRKEKERIDAKF